MPAFTRARISATDLARIKHVPERLVLDREGGGVTILNVDSSVVIRSVLPVDVDGNLDVVGAYDACLITVQYNSRFTVTCILLDIKQSVFCASSVAPK